MSRHDEPCSYGCQCETCRKSVYIDLDTPRVMRTFQTGAIRSSNDSKPDYSGFISPKALKRFGQYMHKHQVCEDGSLRSSSNWKKGIPQESYKESLIRHVIDFWDAWERGDKEACEELACAIFFNTQGFLHERIKEKENEKASG